MTMPLLLSALLVVAAPAPTKRLPCQAPHSLTAAGDPDHWRCMRAQAEKGDRFYQYSVGLSLIWGGGVEGKKLPEGIAWLTRAAKAGDAQAMKVLGEVYIDQEAVRDYDLAYEWTYLASRDPRYQALAKKGMALPAFSLLAPHVDEARAARLRAQAPRLLK